MIGLDTSFLVAFEIADHPRCIRARGFAERYAEEGFALAPQVLAEFIHVVTDPERFRVPLSMTHALTRSRRWWHAHEVSPVFPTLSAIELFHAWIDKYALGRKRLLDTMLAATYVAAGVTRIVTTDARDFSIFPSLSQELIRQ